MNDGVVLGGAMLLDGAADGPLSPVHSNGDPAPRGSGESPLGGCGGSLIQQQQQPPHHNHQQHAPGAWPGAGGAGTSSQPVGSAGAELPADGRPIDAWRSPPLAPRRDKAAATVQGQLQLQVQASSAHQQQDQRRRQQEQQQQQQQQAQVPLSAGVAMQAPRRMSGLTGAFRKYATDGDGQGGGGSGPTSPAAPACASGGGGGAVPNERHAQQCGPGGGASVVDGACCGVDGAADEDGDEAMREDAGCDGGDEADAAAPNPQLQQPQPRARVLAAADAPDCRTQQQQQQQQQPLVAAAAAADDLDVAGDMPSSNLTVRLSSQLASTYRKCSPRSSSAPQQLPPGRRVLTHPSAGVRNEGWDNEAHDLVLATGDVLVNASGQR
ncbi:hypothetical protein MNEG_14753 [Monoraphidium neglectum]|uniref:Uncharacterized protein n=1 Tax=Monoraphidium neglectum TaxID=145388 RepID=A0A0D2LN41_9CHLO|nr:hypothetical protein MNEG_14753 [Monoraphidium neglectum]KIY93209.1 hypothetical protein MNEG_14753 [Monoraphidium neglectum]|eukprot:XP_013892229.1 hypothetical protein MNEG_14753 [Monoraphidium neglectum]